jgi:hypothetical protein
MSKISCKIMVNFVINGKKENLTEEELSLEKNFDKMIYFIQESKWFKKITLIN